MRSRGKINGWRVGYSDGITKEGLRGEVNGWCVGSGSAATRIFRGDETRRRRGAKSRIFRGSPRTRRSTNPRRHCVVDATAFATLFETEGFAPPPNARVAVYAVFDGHNGRRVADLASRLFPTLLARELGILAKKGGGSKHPWRRPKLVEAALKRVCAGVELAARAPDLEKEGCCCVRGAGRGWPIFSRVPF